MAFLAPLFFLGLAVLAVPVLIHLTQREKKMVQQFPSLMFVRRIPYQTVRRRKIRDLALLMVRLTALALIIGAFARPFLWRPDAATAIGPGAREVVVLLDQSYSMAYGDRWDRAKAAARDAINALGPSDRGSVVLFSSGADIALRSTAERDRLVASFATATPTPAATRYGPALKVAGSILAESPLPRREVILVSDFQRNGWRGEEGSRLPAGSIVTPVLIGGPTDKPDAAVTSVSLARSTFSNQERVTVTAAVANRTDTPVANDSLTLEIGGRGIQTEPLNVSPNGSASVAFAPFTVPSRNMRVSVRAGSDALATDNVFHFVISPVAPVRVIVVDPGTRAGGGLYLTRALSIGDAPHFDTVLRQPANLSDDDLRRASVVLLNDVDVPLALGRRLGRFVQDGGGLFVAAGPKATWPQEADVLPASLSQPIDRSRGESGRVGALEYGHPVFEIFRAPRSGDFSTARFYSYRSVTALPASQVLARFDAGTPALVERKLGGGRVLLWASTLDLSWSDLPLKPVFLPFIHRTMVHLASYTEPAPWLTIGQVFDPAAASAKAQATGRLALTPSGRRLPLEDEGSQAQVLELTEQGFYEIRGQKANSDVTVIASNVDPAESDMTPLDPAEIVAAATGNTGANAQATNSDVPLTPQAQERSQRLWWYLLCAGIVLLGADTLFSNWLSKT
jgi:aerotolerance regulator-like protein/VWA domain-containing protein